MARIKGPKKVHWCSAKFKLKAVKLSNLSGVQVRDVAEALDIHPFMLSRWRKQAREGQVAGTVPELDLNVFAELQRLRELERRPFHGVYFHTDRDLRTALLRYVAFYNQKRLHSFLDFVPPVTFERLSPNHAGVN